jgi:hypothetical protein
MAKKPKTPRWKLAHTYVEAVNALTPLSEGRDKLWALDPRFDETVQIDGVEVDLDDKLMKEIMAGFERRYNRLMKATTDAQKALEED